MPPGREKEPQAKGGDVAAHRVPCFRGPDVWPFFCAKKEVTKTSRIPEKFSLYENRPAPGCLRQPGIVMGRAMFNLKELPSRYAVFNPAPVRSCPPYLAISQSTMAAAMEALSDSARPCIGIVIRLSQRAAVSGRRPAPSLPIRQTQPSPSPVC